MVTASLPLRQPGLSRIDVTVSALGDASNLLGGTLLETPLVGADGELRRYAVSQGLLGRRRFAAGDRRAWPMERHRRTPTAEDLARLDRKRKIKKLRTRLGLEERPRGQDPPRFGGRHVRHLAYKPARTPCDLDTGAVSGRRATPGRSRATRRTLEKTLAAAKENLEAVGRGTDGRRPGRMCDRQGLSLTVGLKGARRRPLEDADLRAQADQVLRAGTATGRPAGHVTNNRTRLLAGVARKPSPCAPRSSSAPFAHNLDRGGMRRNACAGAERAQAIPAPCRRPPSESPDAHKPIGAGIPREAVARRIWLICVLICASWSRSGRSDGPHRLGGWRNRLRRVMFRRRVKPGQ